MTRLPVILALVASLPAFAAAASGRPAWVESASVRAPGATVLALVPAAGGDAAWLQGGAGQGLRSGMVLAASRGVAAGARVLVVVVSADHAVGLPVALPPGAELAPASVLEVVTR